MHMSIMGNYLIDLEQSKKSIPTAALIDESSQ
jgi:hypothetical protein